MASDGGLTAPPDRVWQSLHGPGRLERDRGAGSIRRPDLADYYGRLLHDVTPGEFEFRVALFRDEGRGRDRLVMLDNAVTSLDWTDDGPVLGGNLILRRPEPDMARAIPVRDGNEVRLLTPWAGRWYRLWTMRVDGVPGVDRVTGEVTVTLADDLEGLARGEADWEFRKDKRHPHGWRAHDIARFVCRKLGVRVHRLARGDVLIKKLKLKKSTGLAVIKAAYAREKKETHRKYLIRLVEGALDVMPYQRPKVLYELRGIETEVTLEGTPKHSKPRTVIVATGRVDKKKIIITVFHRDVVRRFGRVEWEKDYGKVDSREDLKKQAQSDLAEEIRIKRTLTFTVPGIPFVRRADAFRWINNEPGWHGPAHGTLNREFVYVTTVTHSVAPSPYTMSVTAVQEDPYLADRRRLDDLRREEKQKNREGRSTQQNGGSQ